ncbi:HDIG domain-containing protein, partial [Patescibacteria group bacterium]|nr:HDIG domain-containing protein [Patescibacteria group bacterium]
KLNIEVIKPGDKVKFGKYFEAEFFSLEHTIPDTIGTILKTPVGNMCYFTDFSLDYNLKGEAPILKDFKRVGKQGIHTLIIDSTSAEREGRTISEREVEKLLDELIDKAEGRVVVATFASLLTRINEIMKSAIKHKRKVVLGGFSMKTNIQIAQNLGYIKIPKGAIIPQEEMKNFDDDKILFLCTGAQGESNAQLMKIATGEHKFFETKTGDTFILSSSVIPGNERSIQILKDNLTRQGAKVIQSSHMDIHSSGHATVEELKDAIRAIKPKFMIPAHGYYFMRAANRNLAAEVGVDVNIAKKGGLFHDIGKALDHQVEGSHVDIGMRILEKFGIEKEVIIAMKSHHEDYPYESLEAVIVQTADAISASRPGARKDTLENYLKRIGELETLVTSFDSVERAYAIQAGREIRVFVKPEEIGDLEAQQLARGIANRIEEDLKYPGEIKITLIRENRFIEYAR